MRRMPILYRIAPLTSGGCPPKVLCGIRRNFFRLFPCKGQVAYVLLTRAPVASGWRRTSTPAAPRLACVKPVASVHPEPGSNSSLLLILFFFFQKSTRQVILIIAFCRRHRGDAGRRLTQSSADASLIELLLCRIDLRSRRSAEAPLAFALVLLLVYCNRFQCSLFGPR